jgi:flagellar hook-associated protein 3 FlgL
MRVFSNIEPDVLAGIQQSSAAVQTALQQVSTQQRVNLPGDDPTASALLVQNLAENNNVDQYTKNANAALGQAQTADSVLTSVVSLLTQAVSLGTQGANGTNTPANRQVNATQVQGILASVASEANTTYQGVAIFGGTATPTVAFVADTSSATGYAYKGDSGINQVQVGDNLQVQVNISGDKLFTNPTASVLGSLSQLANALQSGSITDIGNATKAVTTALNYLSAQHGIYGNTVNQLTAQETFLGQEKVTLSTQATSLIGIDPATALENLAQAQAHNSAVLAAAAKVLPTTLLDYLK